MQHVASDMRNSVGDGVKLAVLLSHEMLECGRAAVKQGHLLRDVLYGMDAAVEKAAEQLLNASKAVSGNDLLGIASTAADGDTPLAKIVLEAFRAVGKDGIISVEEGTGDGIELDVQEGMYFERGFLTPDFVTDEKLYRAVLTDAYVLICDYKLSSMRELLPVLEQVARAKGELLVIADDVEGEALSTLIVNQQRGTLRSIPVKAPGYADRRRAILEDIATLTGGVLLSRTSGYSLENVQLGQLGRAKRVTVSKDSTEIIGGAGVPAAIARRVEGIRNQIDSTHDDMSREKLVERLAKLVGGAAVIRVGGVSQQEISDRKRKVVSAMYACRAGIEEGLSTGGGQVFFNVSVALQNGDTLDDAQAAGRDAVVSALTRPIRQQIDNARANPEVVMSEIIASKSATVGFNALTRKVEDLLAAGVVDSTKVLRLVLRVAFAHARAILQTGAWSFEIDKAGNGANILPIGEIPS